VKAAIREALQDSRGKISRRAITLYVLLTTEVVNVFADLFWHKHLDSDTENHLYLLISSVLASILFDPLMNKKNKGQDQIQPQGPAPGQL
jgi:hypothetical protein